MGFLGVASVSASLWLLLGCDDLVGAGGVLLGFCCVGVGEGGGAFGAFAGIVSLSRDTSSVLLGSLSVCPFVVAQL